MLRGIRKLVAERAGHCCEYCLSQARFCPDPFSIEHIIPKTKGGKNDMLNLALSCQGCNNRKYVFTTAIDPITGLEVPLFHPRDDVWNVHFRWNGLFTKIIGKTPTGRATVEILELNRIELVNLRDILATVGEHPPLR